MIPSNEALAQLALEAEARADEAEAERDALAHDLAIVLHNRRVLAARATPAPLTEAREPAHALLRASRRDIPPEVRPAPRGNTQNIPGCQVFFGLAGSVYGPSPTDRCDACHRTRAEHEAPPAVPHDIRELAVARLGGRR